MYDCPSCVCINVHFGDFNTNSFKTIRGGGEITSSAHYNYLSHFVDKSTNVTEVT